MQYYTESCNITPNLAILHQILQYYTKRIRGILPKMHGYFTFRNDLNSQYYIFLKEFTLHFTHLLFFCSLIDKNVLTWLYTSLRSSFPSCFIVTLITCITNSIMYWLYMFLNMSFLCCFLVALNWLNVCLKVSYICSLIVTWITNFLVNQVILCDHRDNLPCKNILHEQIFYIYKASFCVSSLTQNLHTCDIPFDQSQ